MSIFAKMKLQPARSGASGPPRDAHCVSPVHAPRGFTLDGHRLSSLYRVPIMAALTLIFRQHRPSSWKKYSAGVRGCETPAVAVGWSIA